MLFYLYLLLVVILNSVLSVISMKLSAI